MRFPKGEPPPKNCSNISKGSENPAELKSKPFVLQKKPFQFVLLDGQQGGYETETDSHGNIFNWVTHAIDFKFSPMGQVKKLSFKCSLQAKSNRSQQVQIILKTASNHILFSSMIRLSAETKTIVSPSIDVGENQPIILHVETDGTPVRLSPIDSRQAAFMISNVAVMGSF